MKRRRTAPAIDLPRHRRSGTVLVFAMIALLIVTLIGASLVQTSAASLRQIRLEQQQMQTFWLADAGCQRAVLRMRSDPGYSGEDWLIPASQLQSRSNARVRISVVPDGNVNTRRITVVAEYPENETKRTRISRQFACTPTRQEAQ